jgi:serine/threonine-protein kinase
MGVVYLADDHRLHRAVALKAIAADVAADPVRRERLRREASAAAQISHPGIAIIHYFEEFGDDLFIVSEFVPGETLRDEISRGSAIRGASCRQRSNWRARWPRHTTGA